jgi:hypothetical protein
MEGGGWQRRLARIAVGIPMLMACLAASAACPPWRGAPVTIGQSGERLCAKHHEPLQKTTVYGPDPKICILVQETKEAANARACSPNALPFGVSRTKSQLYSRVVKTSFCQECETFLQAHARK